MSEEAHLVVPPALAALLRAAVEAGEYPSVDAALADALETWGRRHDRHSDDLAWLKARIERGRLDPSPHLTEAELDARLEAFFAAAAKAADEAA